MGTDTKIGCGCLVIVLIGLVILSVLYLVSHQSITGTLEKTVVDRGNTYFVFRQDGHTETEILENEDKWVFLKFNSGNILMNLEPGKQYIFWVAGWRVPFLSWYRNIITYQEIQ